MCLAAGAEHCGAVTRNGRVLQWGINEFCQLGLVRCVVLSGLVQLPLSWAYY
jgi:alpha-tubulin suppressor-like RCC1 family protein